MMNIIRLVNVHNEADILPYNLNWYIDQGISTLAIDNGSTDGSLEILKKYLGNGILEIKVIETKHFDRRLLFNEATKLAHKYNPDWVIFADCDEFFEPLDRDFNTLHELIEHVAGNGDNLIQFHNMEFWMTFDDDLSILNPLERMKYYSYFDSNRYKVFKFFEGFSLVPKMGHAPTFPKFMQMKLSKYKGISRHYKIRSLNQGRYKVKRVIPEPGKLEFGFHYIKFGIEPEWYIINSSKLNFYSGDRKWNFKRTFNGHRMNNEELCNYLNLRNEKELTEWLKKRTQP